MDRRGPAALAGLIGLLAVGPAQAAEPESWLYFVNAAARPVTLVVDGTFIDLPARARVSRPAAAGPHGLAAVLGVRTVSVYDSLDAAVLTAERRGRAYWCFLAGEIKGAPHLTQLDAGECRRLVEAGGDDPPGPP